MTDYTITLALYLVMAIGVLLGYLCVPKPPTPIARKDWLPPDDDGYVSPQSNGIGEFLANALNPPEKKPYLKLKKAQPWMGGLDNE